MSQYWEVTFFDGEIATSDDYIPREIPDKPAVVVIQPGSEARGGFPDLLINVNRILFLKSLDCWREMDIDDESLGTFLRIQAHDLECFRPGYWVPDFNKYRDAALARLAELK